MANRSTPPALNNTSTIVIPAYQEEKGLPIVLNKLINLLGNKHEIMVVDDGSSDATSEVAKKFPVKLIRHEKNKGKGEAIITGWKNASNENIIFIDADDTYPVDVIPLIIDKLMDYDMVYGSRRYGKENIPTLNRFGNFIFRNLIRKIYGFTPYDPLTGLWGIRKRNLGECLPTVRSAPDAEIAIKGARKKFKMFDIAITYAPRVGETKLHPLKGGYEHLQLIIGLLFWK